MAGWLPFGCFRRLVLIFAVDQPTPKGTTPIIEIPVSVRSGLLRESKRPSEGSGGFGHGGHTDN